MVSEEASNSGNKQQSPTQSQQQQQQQSQQTQSQSPPQSPQQSQSPSPQPLLERIAHSPAAGSIFFAVQGQGAYARSLSMPLGAAYQVQVSPALVSV